jgi:hypothetical protein
LKMGPVGEYIEVVDFDPASNFFYPPVWLDNPNILARNGLPPSEGSPQFHQQMVYAVAMITIQYFELALGRAALWAPRFIKNGDKKVKQEFVPRLRIYPHAMREANAYYSPEKKALLFGYFPATAIDPGLGMPGAIVFTCLSHDVVAHETTHALLDGLHRRFIEPTNEDVLAFHEAFADIVALFQHFTLQEALQYEIGKTRGNLRDQNFLGELAQQFGQAIGNHGALRSAIGETDENNVWHRQKPDPSALQDTLEPHARGALLVAAVFDAFLSIYGKRTDDLLRIATNGTGVLPQGAIHPDLVDRLASEAAKAAKHVLVMCIRALDYCPPVDLTFGEYLRAIITADIDMVPDDKLNYRVAFIEAFRKRGIYPRELHGLGVESLKWNTPTKRDQELLRLNKSNLFEELNLDWKLQGDREVIFGQIAENGKRIHEWLARIRSQYGKHESEALAQLLGLDFELVDAPFEVHSVRPARRVGPDGNLQTDVIIEITQRKAGFIDPADREKFYKAYPNGFIPKSGAKQPKKNIPIPDFKFRGGCTLIVDIESGNIRYIITKHITSKNRLQREQDYRSSSGSLFATYFSEGSSDRVKEPFAMLHRSFGC